MSDKGPTNTIANWLIAFGIAFAAFLWWASSGFLGFGDIGQDLYNGQWDCWTGGEQGLGRMYGPAITVENGKVIEAHHFNMSTGQEVPAPFSNVQVISPTELTLDSTYFLDDYADSFTCKKES